MNIPENASRAGEEGPNVTIRSYGSARTAIAQHASEKTATVDVSSLTKFFRRADGTIVKALDEVSLTVSPGEFVVLLGPSGCGKTTLLRCVAGLERPDSGRILIGETTVFNGENRSYVPTNRRKLSMVFQSYALWPHMTVAKNVAYPLHCQRPRMGKEEIASRVETVLKQVGIANLAGQYPNQISGGQQQRVALARALVNGTNLILFDEPLSNVDAKVRDQLRAELIGMQEEVGFAALYVTHDQAEAMQLGHRIAVLGDGKIKQFGRGSEIYNEPCSRYVANFIGTTNELSGKIVRADGDMVLVETSIGAVLGVAGVPGLKQGDAAVILWRPEHTRIGQTKEASDSNSWSGAILSSAFLGSYTEERIKVGGQTLLRWSVTRSAEHGSGQWRVSVDSRDVRVLPAGNENLS